MYLTEHQIKSAVREGLEQTDRGRVVDNDESDGAGNRLSQVYCAVVSPENEGTIHSLYESNQGSRGGYNTVSDILLALKSAQEGKDDKEKGKEKCDCTTDIPNAPPISTLKSQLEAEDPTLLKEIFIQVSLLASRFNSNIDSSTC